jgi:hypothetical protein
MPFTPTTRSLAQVSEVPGFKIQELSGRKRTVWLTERAKPYGPITWEGEQRVKVTFPAGNPHGFATVQGPTEGETTIDGFWKDKYLGYNTGETAPINLYSRRNGAQLGEATPVTSVADAVALFDSIRSEGQVLEVSWGYVVRRGVLKKFTQKWHNIHDCEWSMAFVWTSKSRVETSPLFGPPAGQRELGSSLRDKLAKFARAVDAPKRLADGFMSELRNDIAAIAQFTYDIDESISGSIDAVSPTQLSGGVLAAIGSIRNIADTVSEKVQAQGFVGVMPDFDQVAASPWEQARESWLATIDPEEIFKAQLYERELITDARRLRDAAVAHQRAMSSSTSDTLGTYKAREGEDLRDVSQLYFGTPYEWRAIMIYNGLSSPELYGGQTIAIPRLDAVNPEVI